MNTAEKRVRLTELQKEIRELSQQISGEEQRCIHGFGKTVYDPIQEPDYQFSHYEGRGSDPEPVHRVVGTKETPRWKRVCTQCGKVEHTQKTKSTASEPDFG